MNSIHFDFLPENLFWQQDATKKDFYLYFELQGAEASQSAARVPLNLSLVIDRSGSMSGEKIEFAKKAAQFVVNNLSKRDAISIVQYDDEVEIVSPSAHVSDKKSLSRKIDSITARSTTNLSGGLLAGYTQTGTTKADGVVNRVLLLSDGLANQGVTDPNLLQQLVMEKFRNQGLAVSTFGVGADFDEKLMTSLSEYGGGNYYFIDSPDKIPSIFAKELEGLLAVVAQNTMLELKFPEGFRCVEIMGYPADVSENSAHVRFNDVYSMERKAILVKFSVDEAPAEDFRFSAKLSYNNALEAFKQVAEQKLIHVGIAKDQQQLESGAVKKVAEQTTLFIASQMLEKAVRLNEAENYEGARGVLENAKQLVTQQLQLMPGSGELTKLLESINQLLAAQVNYEIMKNEERSMLRKTMRLASYDTIRKRD